MPALHHVGAVVLRTADFDSAVSWWAKVLEADVLVREALTSPDAAAIGLPDAADGVARLEGALLQPRAGGSLLELHRFAEPVTGAAPRRAAHDEGLSHIALSVPADRLAAEGERLARLGVHWLSPVQEITTGALCGVRWRYGVTPRVYGALKLEITAWQT